MRRARRSLRKWVGSASRYSMFRGASGVIFRTVGLITTLVFGVLAAPVAAEAQAGKVTRVGFLRWGSGGGEVEAFRQGLRELGYVEGKNIAIEDRNAEGRTERLPNLVAELIRIPVDVIVAFTTPATRAVQQATSTIPIVTVSADPVGTGLITSLARPGGNTTGLSLVGPEADGKALGLLKEAIPSLRRVAFVWDPANAALLRRFQAVEAAARSLGLQLDSVVVTAPGELENALESAIGKHAGALFVPTAMASAYRRQIVDFTARKRWPAIYADPASAEAGGLMVYSTNIADQFRRAAIYVDKILKGAKPADLPVEQPTKFELVINLKTAQALGLTIPQSVLLQADKIIK